MGKYSEENLSRIGNAAIYIAEHISDLSKTKLLKLLYLMEERSALKYQQPFLAIPYEVWQAGPVPKDIFIDLSDGPVLLSSYVETEPVKLDDGKTALYVHPIAAFDDSDFSAYEIRLMDEVLKEYGDKTATELVDIVHKENTLWYQIAKEHGLLEAFKNHESNNSDYVIDFAKAMLPCAADYYREALAIHTASTDKSQINIELKGKLKSDVFTALKNCLKNSDAVRKRYKQYL